MPLSRLDHQIDCLKNIRLCFLQFPELLRIADRDDLLDDPMLQMDDIR